MKAFPRLNRNNQINKIRSDLERDSFPRLQMCLLVTITGAAGFVASFTLLQVGFTEMWLRYLISFGIAYLMFLLLLWLWLRTRADDYRADNYIDIPDFTGHHPSPSSAGNPVSGGGGDFGGAGASAHYDMDSGNILGVSDSGDVASDALGAAAEAEEFAIPLVVLIFIGVLLMSSFFMIYSAPVLFAELIVDGVLSASLYHRLRGLETNHWLETAIRRTVWPFLLTALIVSASGWAMKVYAPEAHSIGDVVSHSKRAN